MKCADSEKHSRYMVVSGLPQRHPDDLTELEVQVNYVGDSSIRKAVPLDQYVVPRVKDALNGEARVEYVLLEKSGDPVIIYSQNDDEMEITADSLSGMLSRIADDADGGLDEAYVREYMQRDGLTIGRRLIIERGLNQSEQAEFDALLDKAIAENERREREWAARAAQ